MAELPTGTVTFLFTDIEGSTELLSALGDKYRYVLERHNELLRAAFARHNGHEVSTEGDAFFVAFTSAPDAVAAAIEGQRALHSEPWPEGRALKVRMGMHTGMGMPGAGNYVGLDVHRAARIAAAGHGGEILVSDATRALSGHALPEGASLRDLGSHRLKGLPAAERIFQVLVDGLPSDFPPIRSLEVRPNNLPVALTSFVGRETQIAEIRDLLGSTRLLTMTGPGGTGKTRLCIRVAEEVIADYEHGCWFVALDALRDPELVPSTIADALDVRVPPDKSAMEALESWLADRSLLLVLDNFEQITDGARYITQLLGSAAGIRVLATSRVPLHVYGEQEYPVPPLAGATDLRAVALADPEALSKYEAVRLFIERAAAVQPSFALTNANATAVAEICARLDGLPLAIELCAARIKLLTPEQMLGRLEQNLSLLASTARDLPERQRTLRGAIEWSHELLSDGERRLFARLSVFRGGFTVDAAEQVCGGSGVEVDVLDGLSALVDNSLVHAEPSVTVSRFRMLETIGEFAREQLAEAADHDDVTRRHAGHFFALARDAGAQLTGPESEVVLDRLRVEQDNLRAAFERAPGIGLLDDALVAAGAMWRFWQLRNEFAEGRATLERLLELPGADPRARAGALTGAGGIAYWQGDFVAMARHYVEAREIYETIGDDALLAEALYNEAFVTLSGNDPVGSRPMFRRAIDLYAKVGDEMAAAGAELFMGNTYMMTGDHLAALPWTQKAIASYRAMDARWMLGDALTGLAFQQAAVGDWPAGMASLRECIAIFKELENDLGLEMALESYAGFAAWAGEFELAVRLLGKTDEMRERMGGGPPLFFLGAEPFRARTRNALEVARYEELYSEGRQLTTADAIEAGGGLRRAARDAAIVFSAPPGA